MSKNKTKRAPIVSGIFYPSNSDELSNIIDKYINNIDEDNLKSLIKEQTSLDIEKRRPLVIISPHASYMFSGKTQAYSYKAASGYSYDSVIIIGVSHQQQFKGISVNMDSEYETPLGSISVNQAFAETLKKYSKKITTVEDVHLQEHSIEVQLPYIQKLFTNAKIIPILFGEQHYEYSQELHEAISKTIDEMPGNYLTVITTDLSYYHNYLDAKTLDEALITDIKSMDPKKLYSDIKGKKCEACCYAGIITGIMLSKAHGEGKVAVLEYVDSGKITGDRRKVVGYLSAVLF